MFHIILDMEKSLHTVLVKYFTLQLKKLAKRGRWLAKVTQVRDGAGNRTPTVNATHHPKGEEKMPMDLLENS